VFASTFVPREPKVTIELISVRFVDLSQWLISIGAGANACGRVVSIRELMNDIRL
jgi:hypothetical protein